MADVDSTLSKLEAFSGVPKLPHSGHPSNSERQSISLCSSVKRQFRVAQDLHVLEIAPSGHTRNAMRQMELIREIDPKLSDSKYVETLFGEHPVPKKLRLEWYYNHLDFGLLNVPSGHFICMMRDPN